MFLDECIILKPVTKWGSCHCFKHCLVVIWPLFDLDYLWAGKELWETFMISEEDSMTSQYLIFKKTGRYLCDFQQTDRTDPNLHIIIICILQGKDKDSCLADM